MFRATYQHPLFWRPVFVFNWMIFPAGHLGSRTAIIRITFDFPIPWSMLEATYGSRFQSAEQIVTNVQDFVYVNMLLAWQIIQEGEIG